jgi:hypothetical protein
MSANIPGILLSSRSCSACRVESAASSMVGGGFRNPLRLNCFSLRFFLKSYWTTPPNVLLGWLIITSPRRMSRPLGKLGMPPLIPTISPKRSPLNVRSMSLAILAAAFVPYTPAGKQAMTTLCSAQHVVIGIEFVLTRDRLMPLVQRGDCRRHLMTKSTDDAHLVLLDGQRTFCGHCGGSRMRGRMCEGRRRDVRENEERKCGCSEIGRLKM